MVLVFGSFVSVLIVASVDTGDSVLLSSIAALSLGSLSVTVWVPVTSSVVELEV